MKNSNLLLILSLILFSTEKVLSQPCSCSNLLTELISKVKSNYAGYIHKVKEADNSQYVEFEKHLRDKAVSMSFEDCFDVLVDYVDWFEDGHLFIYEAPGLTEQQTDSLALQVIKYDLPVNFEEKLKEQQNSDPIEGIWKDDQQTIAIVHVKDKLYYGVITFSATLPFFQKRSKRIRLIRPVSNPIPI